MATIIDRLNTLVRVNLDDEIKSRFKDEQLLVFMKQAIQRAQGLGFSEKLNFMRGKKDFVLSPGSDSLHLPEDFIVQIGVWDKSRNKALENKGDEDWEQISCGGPLSYYHIEDEELEIKGTCTENTPIRLRYYKSAMIDRLTLSSQMPWGSKIDYPICEYVTIRALHVDRYNTSSDAAILANMEQSIINMYSSIDPTLGDVQGAF